MSAEKPDPTVFASGNELAHLRELRNEVLVEVPIKMSQFAERVRLASSQPGELHSVCNEMIVYGLRLKRLAEEAR